MRRLPRVSPRCTLSLLVSLGVATACRSARVQPTLSGVDPSSPVTAFVDVTVVPMDTDRVLPGQTVLIQGHRITALGPVNRVSVPASAVRIDGRGKFLIPGLADMHTHLMYEDSATTESSLLNLLSHGITTIRNADFKTKTQMRNDSLHEGYWLLRLRARAASGAILSPRIYTSGPWAGATAGRPVDAATAIPAYKAAGYDFIKIHDEDNIETFDSVAAVARRIGMPFIGHIPLGLSLEQAWAAGYRSIEHGVGYLNRVNALLEPLRKQGIDMDKYLDTATTIPGLPELAAATRRAGVWICTTMSLSYSKWGWRSHKASHEGRRLVKALQDAGVGLLPGTDAISRSDTSFGWTSDELEMMVAAGLTPYQALVTGTRNVAVFFGTLNESGTVTVGKRADLVLLEGNPLVDIRNVAQTAGVMLGGRWFYQADLNQRLVAAGVTLTPRGSRLAK